MSVILGTYMAKTTAREAHRLRIARIIDGLDIRQLAQKLGLSFSMVSRMENGKRTVNQRVIKYAEGVIKAFVKGELE